MEFESFLHLQNAKREKDEGRAGFSNTCESSRQQQQQQRAKEKAMMD
jgi:hypothetical protein